MKKQQNKCYPMTMDGKVYDTFKAIAQAKSITVKTAIRDALGLYLADNLDYIMTKKIGVTTHEHSDTEKNRN